MSVLTLLQLVLVVIGLYAQRQQLRFRPQGGLPREGVSVIIPIKGLDPGADEHFRTWLNQDVDCPYEVIFSLQDPADPAIPVLQDLVEAFDRTPARILVNPVLNGLNGKASNLHHGVAAARYRFLVMADADIAPTSDFVQRLVPPLQDESVGQVNALPIVKGASNLAGGLMEMTWNMGLTSNWAPQAFLGAAKTAPGGCFAIRRAVLELIGGIPAFGGSVAEDMAMTRKIREAGLRMVMGPAVTLDQGSSTWAALDGYYSRCAYGVKHLGSVGDRVFTYLDKVGRVLTVTDRAGWTWAYDYDIADRVTKQTDPLGRETAISYTDRDQVAKVTRPGNDDGVAVTSYTWDVEGRLASLTDPLQKLHSYTYDGAGRLTHVDNPLKQTYQYSYDGEGNVISSTDPEQRTTQFRYDGSNRLTLRIGFDGSETGPPPITGTTGPTACCRQGTPRTATIRLAI